LSDASPLDDPGIPELPSTVFEVNTTLLVTGDFERYFQSMIQFCPPLEPTLQALNTALAGLEREYWELLPENARGGLEMLDIDRSRNRKFFSNVRDLYRTSGEFGVSIDTEESADALGALEKLRYRSWRNSVSGDAPSEELFADAFKKGSNSSSSIDSLSKSLLVSPIYLNNGGYPTLETVTRESTNMHYDSSQAIHISAIADVLDFNQVKFDEW